MIMNRNAIGNYVIAAMLFFGLLATAVVVWDASRTRPVNTVIPSSAYIDKDGNAKADFEVINRTLIPPTIRRAIYTTDGDRVDGAPLATVVSTKVTLGAHSAPMATLFNVNDVDLAPGCYEVRHVSELVYLTWFSTKRQYYSYTVGPFCIK